MNGGLELANIITRLMSGGISLRWKRMISQMVDFAERAAQSISERHAQKLILLGKHYLVYRAGRESLCLTWR